MDLPSLGLDLAINYDFGVGPSSRRPYYGPQFHPQFSKLICTGPGNPFPRGSGPVFRRRLRKKFWPAQKKNLSRPNFFSEPAKIFLRAGQNFLSEPTKVFIWADQSISSRGSDVPLMASCSCLKLVLGTSIPLYFLWKL